MAGPEWLTAPRARAAAAGVMACGHWLSAQPAAAQIDIARFVTIRQGQVPIIISAPHGGEVPLRGIATRENRGQKFFEIVRDQRTSELSEALAAHLTRQLGGAPFVVIARFERRHADANRASEDAYAPPGDGGPKLVYDAYHKALAAAATEVTRRWGRGLLLDIHGQARVPDTIVRGTENGQSVKSLLQRFGEQAVSGPASVFGALAAKGYRVAPTGAANDREERLFRGGHIVNTYGSGRGGAVVPSRSRSAAATGRPTSWRRRRGTLHPRSPCSRIPTCRQSRKSNSRTYRSGSGEGMAWPLFQQSAGSEAPPEFTSWLDHG